MEKIKLLVKTGQSLLDNSYYSVFPPSGSLKYHCCVNKEVCLYLRLSI